ncbi:MAG: type II toxin-antitoxin system prevent-host-death family antitoxin [Candidatus Sericytochromatia bacterium]|nr:type II toxin-antitoxin system prevent-host-death family antitoxin [Candidatus Sericytochromatia bacterium]
MRIVNIHEAKTHLSRLLEQVAAGEDVVIAKAGKPVARLTVYEPGPPVRTPGRWRGQVQLAPDFDALPAELMRAFEGEGP